MIQLKIMVKSYNFRTVFIVTVEFQYVRTWNLHKRSQLLAIPYWNFEERSFFILVIVIKEVRQNINFNELICLFKHV